MNRSRDRITQLRTLIGAGDYDLIPGHCPNSAIDVVAEKVLQELRRMNMGVERVWHKNRPKSECVCGHTGDGPGGSHAPGVRSGVPGHGPCQYPGCDCEQFTWKDFLPWYKKELEEWEAELDEE